MGRIWIWTKVIFFAVLLVYVIVFCTINQDQSHETNVWVFVGKAPKLSVLEISAGSFLAGVIATIFIRTIWVTLRQLRDLKERNRAERLNRDVADLKYKAAMLQPRPETGLGDSEAKT